MREILTRREKEILDTLTKVEPKLAALRLGIKTKTIYNTLYRLRKKHLAARKFINIMLSYRRAGIKIEELLTPRKKLTLKDEAKLGYPLEEELEE